MMNFADLASAPCDPVGPFTEQLRLAVAVYLARFKGSSRYHTESDLRCYLSWCSQHRLDPLAARRPHLELYIRWMQEIRRFKPSTVSRRFSVAAGFYRTCVIDGLLEHSPAEHVRRPSVPAESPTLGFTHLQFEALQTAARMSSSPCDFALVAMLGLLGLRIFEATSADITDLGEEHGHRVLRVCGERHQGRPDPAATRRRTGHRQGHWQSNQWPHPAQQPGRPHGPACRDTTPATPRASLRSANYQPAPTHAQTHVRHNHAGCWGRLATAYLPVRDVIARGHARGIERHLPRRVRVGKGRSGCTRA
jgi:integrase